MAINLEPLRWESAPDSEYAVVNIPAFQLKLVRRGQVVQTHRVVVGKPSLPTPTLDSRILVFNTCSGENGRLHCYPDVYGQDAALLAAFFARP